MRWPNKVAHQFQFVGEMAKSAKFGFCALPMNRIITKAKERHPGLGRLDIHAHVSTLIRKDLNILPLARFNM